MKATYTIPPSPPPPLKRLTIEFEEEDIQLLRLAGWATSTFPDALARDTDYLLHRHEVPFRKFQQRLQDALNRAGVPSVSALGLV